MELRGKTLFLQEDALEGDLWSQRPFFFLLWLVLTWCPVMFCLVTGSKSKKPANYTLDASELLSPNTNIL